MLIGYMRVSSRDDRQTTDLQYDALISAGVDPRHIYKDKMTGRRDNRPQLQEALDFLQPDDCLVVWKLDRLGRSLSHLIKIINSLKEKGIAFRSLTEHMDTTTPQGELLFNIFGSLAQYEVGLIRERVMAGLSAAEKRGRKGGRPKAISDEQLQTIRRLMAEDNASKAEICRTFNIKRSTLYDALSRTSEV